MEVLYQLSYPGGAINSSGAAPLEPLRRRLPRQLALTRGRVSRRLPLWPVKRTLARCTPRQTSVELTSRPLLPPLMFSTKALTGASGAVANVARMPPRTESIRPESSMST